MFSRQGATSYSQSHGWCRNAETFREFLQNITRIVNIILYISHSLKYLIICFLMLKYTYGFLHYIAYDIIVICTCNCKLKKHNQKILSDVLAKIRIIFSYYFVVVFSLALNRYCLKKTLSHFPIFLLTTWDTMFKPFLSHTWRTGRTKI